MSSESTESEKQTQTNYRTFGNYCGKSLTREEMNEGDFLQTLREQLAEIRKNYQLNR